MQHGSVATWFFYHYLQQLIYPHTYQGADYTVVFSSLTELASANGMDLSALSLAFAADTSGRIVMSVMLGSISTSLLTLHDTVIALRVVATPRFGITMFQKISPLNQPPYSMHTMVSKQNATPLSQKNDKVGGDVPGYPK